jgi:hypothetical protein
MTQDEIKALIEDLRLNHEFCPKEVILQAADELEKQRTWVGLDPETMRNTTLQFNQGALWAERYLKEKNT